MADCADDRYFACINLTSNNLFIERPQILNASTATSDNQCIDVKLLCMPYLAYDLLGSHISLNQR